MTIRNCYIAGCLLFIAAALLHGGLVAGLLTAAAAVMIYVLALISEDA